MDKKWNWLVGEYEDPLVDVANIHWTIGGPYFDEYKNVDFEDECYRTRSNGQLQPNSGHLNQQSVIAN